MFIAHIPSGYLMSVSLLRRMRSVSVSASAVIAAGIVGAFAPDLDLIYLYLFDHGRTHHHRYVSHWPSAWLASILMSGLWFHLGKRSKPAFLALVFGMGGMLHLILDSLVGDIWWFAPFVAKPYSLFTVPARFDPWWLNFVFHWSFAVELAICGWAFAVYRSRSTWPGRYQN